MPFSLQTEGEQCPAVSVHPRTELDASGCVCVLLFFLINSPTITGSPTRTSRYGEVSCIEGKKRRKKERKRGPAHRSGGGVDFGTVLSPAQDLVQSSGHVVGPGGGAVVPLQVFAWERRPGARGEEDEEEEEAGKTQRGQERESQREIRKKKREKEK